MKLEGTWAWIRVDKNMTSQTFKTLKLKKTKQRMRQFNTVILVPVFNPYVAPPPFPHQQCRVIKWKKNNTHKLMTSTFNTLKIQELDKDFKPEGLKTEIKEGRLKQLKNFN
jgi:hypothetical protein